MTKKDQRDLTAKKFNDKVEKNIFLREHYKARDCGYNGKRLTKPAVCGFKKRAPCEEEECEEVCEEKITLVEV